MHTERDVRVSFFVYRFLRRRRVKFKRFLCVATRLAGKRQEGLQRLLWGWVGSRHLGRGLRGSCAILGRRVAGVG